MATNVLARAFRSAVFQCLVDNLLAMELRALTSALTAEKSGLIGE